MGGYPEWFPLFVAAETLHVPPWTLLEQSIWWQQKAHIKNSAEIQAREIKAQHNKR